MVDPFLVTVVTLFAALPLLRTKYLVCARAIICSAIVALVIVGYGPIGPLAVKKLEDTFPPVYQIPEEINGIIVLGGIGTVRGRPSLYSSGARLVDAYQIARAQPHMTLLISGGSKNGDWSEALSARRFLVELGISSKRIHVEDQSIDTAQNAVFSAVIAKQEKDVCWALMTSAFHMPRALAAFQSAGLSALPMPVDFKTSGDDRDWQWFARTPIENFALLGLASHEWIGMLWYWLTAIIIRFEYTNLHDSLGNVDNPLRDWAVSVARLDNLYAPALEAAGVIHFGPRGAYRQHRKFAVMSDPV